MKSEKLKTVGLIIVSIFWVLTIGLWNEDLSKENYWLWEYHYPIEEVCCYEPSPCDDIVLANILDKPLQLQ